MYKLEDRILFDGAAVADVTEAQKEAEAQQQAAQAAAEAEEAAAQQNDSADSAEQDASESSDPGSLQEVLAAVSAGGLGADGQRIDVLVVSSSLENADDICNTADADTIVVVYDASTTSAADLLQQITDALNGNVADSIGFVTESGETAAIQLFADTDTSLDTVADSTHQSFFSGLDALLDDGGTVNLFASNLASTTEGEALVDAIGEALGHDVAASSDETGGSSAGGDWDLEYSTNGLETDAAAVYLDENLADNFDSLLEDHVNHEIAFINSSVMNVDEILDDLGDNVEVVILDSGTDALDYITDYLNEHSDVKYDAVHIITHGNEGYFVLNGEVIDSDYVSENASDFVQWRNALSEDADIMIYGCNLTGSLDGQNLVATIASLTGADVAASTGTVGGNDWSLEYSAGDINYGALDINGYVYHLADQLVTNSDDSGAGSLRQAITDVGNGESITFDNSYTITLTSDVLSIDGKSISIDGGTNNITVTSASYSTFEITATGGLDISNVTITNTSANYAVVNAGTLATSGTVSISGDGGAVDNAATGIFNISDNTTLAGNTNNLGTIELLANATLNVEDNLSGTGTYTFSNTGSTVNYSRDGDGTTQDVLGGTYYNLILSGTAADPDYPLKNITDDLTILNNFTLEGDVSSAYVTTPTNVTYSGGTPSSPITVTALNYQTLTIDGAQYIDGEVTADTVDLNNILTVASGGTLVINTGGTLFHSGHLVVNGTLQFEDSAVWNYTGSFDSGTGEVYYVSTPTNIQNVDYYNLKLGGAPDTEYNWEGYNVSNQLTIQTIIVYATTLDMPILTMTNESDLYISESLAVGSFTTGFYNAVHYNRDDGGSQYIGAYTYFDLYFEGSGEKILAGNITVYGLYAYGGTFVHNNKSVAYAGWYDYMPLEGTYIARLTYYDLVMAGPNNGPGVYNIKEWQNGITVENELIFNSEVDLRVSGGVSFDLDDNQLVTNNKGKIIYYATQTVDAQQYHDLEFYNSSNITIAGTDNILVSGDFINNSATFNVNNSTVTLNGADNQSFDDGAFYNLVLSGAGDKTSTGSIMVQNDMTVEGSTVNIDGDLTVANDMAIEDSASVDIAGNLTVGNDLTFSADGLLSLTGNLSVSGTFDAGTGTVDYAETGDQNIAGLAYYNLTLSNSGTKTLAGNISVAGSLSLEDTAAFNYGTNYSVTYNGDDQTIATFNITYYDLILNRASAYVAPNYASKTAEYNLNVINDLTLAEGVELVINKTFSVGNTADFTTYDTLVTYNGNNQYIGDYDFNNLKVTGDGTKYWDSPSASFRSLVVDGVGLIINSDLDIEDKTVNILSGATLTINSSLIANTNTVFNAETGSTVKYSGAGDQNIIEAGYYNLTLAGTGSKTIVETSSSLTGISIAGVFSIASGVTFVTGDFTVTYNGTIDQTIAVATYSTIILDGSGTKYWNSAIIADTLIFDADVTLVVPTQLNNLGTLQTNDTGTIKYIGSGDVQSLDFWNLELAGSDYSFAAGWSGSIGNNFTVSAGTVTMSADMHILGNISITDSGTLDTVDTYNLSVDGDWNNTGTFLARNATVTFGTNPSHTLTGDTTFNNLVIDNGTLAGTSDITVTGTVSGTNGGTINMSGGTFTYDGADQTVLAGTYNNLTVGANSTGTLTASDVTIGGDLTFDADTVFTISGVLSIGGNLVTNSLGTIEYNGADQTVASGAGNYNNLIISGSGTKTANSSVSVDGNLTVSSTLDANAALVITGDLAGDGTVMVGDTIELSSITGQSTIIYDGNDQTIAVATYSTIILDGSGTKYWNSAIIADTLIFDADVTLVVPTQLNNLGTLQTNDTGTIKYIGSGDVQSLDFWNLELAGSDYSFAAGWSGSIGNNFTVSAGTVTMSADMHILGNISITDSGTLDTVDTYNLSVDGDWNNTGTFLARNATVTFGTNPSHTLTGDTTFNNLVIDNGTLAGTSDITVTGTVSGTNGGTINMSGGTFTYDGADQTVLAGTYNNLTVGANSTGTLTASDVTIGGDLTFDADTVFTISGVLSIGGNLVTNSLGTIEYNGADQTVASGAGNYNNLIISGSGTKTANSSVSVDGNLTVSSTLDANAALVITGDLAGDGTVMVGDTIELSSITGQSTVIYDGASDQTVSTATYYNLAISNGNKTLAGNVTVTNDFSFNSTASLLDISSYTLAIMGEINGASAGSSYFLFSNATAGSLNITVSADSYKTLIIGANYSGTPQWSTLRLIDESSTTNTIGIRAFAHVTSNGTPNGTIIDSETAVNMTFVITANTGAFGMTIYTSSVQGSEFSSFYSELKYYSGGWIDVSNPTSTGSYYFDSSVTPSEDCLYVTSLADDGSKGTLRWAIQQANANEGTDIITFAASLSGTIELASFLAITDDVVITGTAAITVSGENTSQIFVIDDNNAAASINVTISSLTLAAGFGTNGGAIYNNELLVLENIVITSSSATYGGAIYNDYQGGIQISDSIIGGSLADANTAATDGGGIYTLGLITLADTTISYNTAGEDGGGIYVGIYDDGSTINEGSLYTVRTTIERNTATTGSGGGVYNDGGNLQL
ncbi:MAG: DUF4347 domain-containing protein, partial [Victivallaceae bacterium]|nr:DUF4347 domain-containing protein [Victivallaceae bacterium]